MMQKGERKLKPLTRNQTKKKKKNLKKKKKKISSLFLQKLGTARANVGTTVPTFQPKKNYFFYLFFYVIQNNLFHSTSITLFKLHQTIISPPIFINKLKNLI
jgi:hypothetical protein